MKERSNISSISNCFGCGVCACVCSKSIIRIHLNSNGFYEPYIDNPQNCTNCGLCTDVCSYLHNDLALLDSKPLKSWAAWSNDQTIRQKCSSGGIGYEIGKQLIEKGYRAIGCRYNVQKRRAEHFMALTVDEFKQSIGSKYIQSYTEEAFKQIKRKDEKYLVIGTPCQIDSFRRMTQRYRCGGNFILVDFFCHCVPSVWAWDAYIKMHESILGNVNDASWRNKDKYGWHDSWQMVIIGEKGTSHTRWSKGDLFYRLFLGDVCLGPQCQKNCRFKYDKSSADIRIGDLWGKTYQHDEDGVSALVAFTEKGKALIEGLSNVTLVEHPFDIVAEGQMKDNAKAKEVYPFVMSLLKKGVPLDNYKYKILLFVQRIITRIKIILK